jgi:MFS family permease
MRRFHDRVDAVYYSFGSGSVRSGSRRRLASDTIRARAGSERRVVRTRLIHLLRDVRGFPGQFWVLVVGIFVYVAAAALAFPYEGIFLHRVLGVSMTVVGVVFGLVPAAVMPLQMWGGHLTDRLGRRPVILLALFMGVVWFVGFAYLREAWQIAVLVAVESSFGWPLFQTATNAMIADMIVEERRQEAYSISRVAMNVGVVLGPAAGAFALGWGASFRDLFLAAAAGILAITVVMGLRLSESRPESARAPSSHHDERGRTGYRRVLADRSFLLFSAVAVLPVFCIGNFGSIFSVYITGSLGVSYSAWGVLLAWNATIVALTQFPLVRATRKRNRMLLLALSSALLAVGLGASSLAWGIASLVVLVTVMSVGEVFLSPVASAQVADFAPEVVRGRYMGIWTVVWNGGAALGPAYGGWAMDTFGGRQAFATLLVIGLAGAVLFLWLARRGLGVPGVGPGAAGDAPLPAEAARSD